MQALAELEQRGARAVVLVDGSPEVLAHRLAADLQAVTDVDLVDQQVVAAGRRLLALVLRGRRRAELRERRRVERGAELGGDRLEAHAEAVAALGHVADRDLIEEVMKQVPAGGLVGLDVRERAGELRVRDIVGDEVLEAPRQVLAELRRVIDEVELDRVLGREAAVAVQAGGVAAPEVIDGEDVVDRAEVIVVAAAEVVLVAVPAGELEIEAEPAASDGDREQVAVDGRVGPEGAGRGQALLERLADRGADRGVHIQVDVARRTVVAVAGDAPQPYSQPARGEPLLRGGEHQTAALEVHPLGACR